MNYFAHGYHYVGDPYFLAGTAVPDWLSVVDRQVRLTAKRVEPYCTHADPRWAALAAGMVQHYRDDAWFHGTRAFTELSWQLTIELRDRLPGDDGFRPSFLGHILVEILLDAVLIAAAPERLESYYAALGQVDPAWVGAGVEQMAQRPVVLLPQFLPLFFAERFLYDYAADEKLLTRLNRVMQRVHLPPLPDTVRDLLPPARRWVRDRRDELLAGWPSAPG
jgi:hypothetical protein